MNLLAHIDPERVHRFAYSVYVDDLKKNFPQADHQRKMLFDAYDQTAHYVAVSNRHEYIGTCRINRIQPDLPFLSKIQRRYAVDRFLIKSRNVFFVSRLLIKKEYRSSKPFLYLLKGVFNILRDYNDFIIVIDCSPCLTKMYRKLGFREYHHPFVDEVLGEKIPMYFSFGDKSYLSEINSPVLDW